MFVAAAHHVASPDRVMLGLSQRTDSTHTTCVRQTTLIHDP